MHKKNKTHKQKRKQTEQKLSEYVHYIIVVKGKYAITY